MTRKSIIARENKRLKTVKKYAAKRAALKKAFLDQNNSYEDRMAAFAKLQNYLGTQVHQGVLEGAQSLVGHMRSIGSLG